MATAVYTMAPALAERYVEKITGLPLASGYLKFFSDVNRGDTKQVYQRTGSPPDYTYVAIGSQVNLNINGITVDEFGNPIKPIYNLLDVNGDKELYFVEVYNSGDVLQYTQEGWPLTNVIEESADAATDVTNYIANPQFLVHNFESQQIAAVAETWVAPGWVFKRPSDSTATDVVSFNRIGAYTQDPPASPRYEAQVNCISPDGSDGYKILAYRFGDVNMFASEEQQYTFQISGESKTLSNVPVSLYVLKNFGTGGDPDQVLFIGSFQLTPDTDNYNFPILFGSNEGSNIGTLDDDYVEIQLRFPPTTSFSAAVTDAVEVIGSITNLAYPIQTNSDTTVRTYAPPTGSYEGMDFYLPLVRTPQGLTFDDSEVGKVLASFSIDPPVSYLSADGLAYLTAGYSSDGVPYRRLQQKYFRDDKQPYFGTGVDFVVCAQGGGYNGSPNLLLMSNGFGTATAVVDGTTATGFTFNQITAAHVFDGFTAFKATDHELTLRGPRTRSGAITFAPHSSNFTLDNLIWSTTVDATMYDLVTNNNSGTTGLASDYFEYNNTLTTTNYYIWFKVDGTGTDPAVSGATGHLVSLIGSMTTDLVTSAVMCAFNGFQSTYINCIAAGSMTAGAFFKFQVPTNSDNYYVWYTIDGVGTKPIVTDSTAIQVDLVGTDTAIIVANKTLAAINSVYFAVPNLQGLSLRGYDDVSHIWDYNQVFSSGTNPARFNLNPNLNSSGCGTLQLFGNMTHRHQFSSSNTTTPGGDFNIVQVGGGNTSNTREITSNGDQGDLPESRTANIAVNWIIKY